MSASSAIEWTDATWNPTTGCTQISVGCDHCYAKRIVERFGGRGAFDDVALFPQRLDLPLRWRKPRMVFVNSMSDLFHEDIPDGFIARVFATMALAEQHTFQVLTKRHARMRAMLTDREWLDDGESMYVELHRERNGFEIPWTWPLPNVWLGVSVETQRWAEIRIPYLLRTPASVRFLSCEPLLESIDLIGLEALVDWVIVGGESGRDARPMDAEWVRAIRDRCITAGTPFFFKQWGGPTAKAGGRELDGRVWDEFPARQGVLV